jgi:hypothetical protein
MEMRFLAMGVFLYGGLLAGLLAGLMISAVLGGLAAFLAVRLHARRKYVTPIFSLAAVAVLTACIVGIGSVPFDWGQPGSNYDLIMSNLFWAALWYAASPGAAAGVAAIITLMIPTVPRSPKMIPANNPREPAVPPPLPVTDTR